MPGFQLGRYDARMKVPVDAIGYVVYKADDYINVAFLNQFKDYLPDFANYRIKSQYQSLNDAVIRNWAWQREGSNSNFPQSITDIQSSIEQNPGLKLLILHGYEDVATPGYQTELDLKGVNLLDRIPVKWFEGGHMTYNTEVSRAPLKKVLDEYYQAPPYDPANVQATTVNSAAVSN
jgi:carboxypeptidase C (cathepsin A)